MGHQLARAAAAAALILSVSCGGDDDADAPSVLDNALAQVATSTAPGDEVDAVDVAEPPGVAQLPDELPPPDPSLFEGANRFVNLWTGPGGDRLAVDVWGRRTSANGPILLAEEVGFGQATDHLAAPAEYRLVVVATGAGPDGAELASTVNTVDGERLTTVLAAGDGTRPSARNVWETDPSGRFGAPDPPIEGGALIAILGVGLDVFGDELMAAYGSRTFLVGDGDGGCREQRVEADGFEPDVVGGDSLVEIDTEPGPTTISLHPVEDGCDASAVASFEVDVPEDGTRLVLVYSADGASLEAMILPMG